MQTAIRSVRAECHLDTLPWWTRPRSLPRGHAEECSLGGRAASANKHRNRPSQPEPELRSKVRLGLEKNPDVLFPTRMGLFLPGRCHHRTGPAHASGRARIPVNFGNSLIFSVAWQPVGMDGGRFAIGHHGLDGPMALRPRLATGLPLSKMRRPPPASLRARQRFLRGCRVHPHRLERSVGQIRRAVKRPEQAVATTSPPMDA